MAVYGRARKKYIYRSTAYARPSIGRVAIRTPLHHTCTGFKKGKRHQWPIGPSKAAQAADHGICPDKLLLFLENLKIWLTPFFMMTMRAPKPPGDGYSCGVGSRGQGHDHAGGHGAAHQRSGAPVTVPGSSMCLVHSSSREERCYGPLARPALPSRSG